MKKLIGLISVIQSFIGVPIALNLIANDQKLLGFICLAWFSIVILFVGEWLIIQAKKIRAFTLIELLAVITILSILLTVTFRAFKVDPSRSEALQIAGELRLLHAQSFIYDNDKGYKENFIIDKQKFTSVITLSHDELIFEKGEPSEHGYSVELKYKEQEPIIIRVKAFTGKVVYY